MHLLAGKSEVTPKAYVASPTVINCSDIISIFNCLINYTEGLSIQFQKKQENSSMNDFLTFKMQFP